MHYSFFALKVPKSSLFCHLPMLGAPWKSAFMSESRFLPNFESIAPFSRLSDSGILDSGESPMSDEAVLEALRYMMLTRVFDDKATSMQRQGRFGTFSSVRGQEASVVGAATALDPVKDWIVPQYREFPALIRHGYPIENFALYFMGNPKGGTIPPNVNMLPMQISLAAQIPQATGLAWGLKMQGGDGVAITFFGDGASSEGDFHESLNLAGIVKAPVIFFLQNNGWAISTPRENQTAARSFAERAIGYGVEGVIVDGNDLLAVHEVTARAVAKARAGNGPTLIESVTYRTGAHNTADDPSRYVDQQELEKWQQKDPVERVKNYLRSRGIWNENLEQELLDSCAAQIDAAMEIARNTPLATSDALFDHVYAEPPQRMLDQKHDWAIRNGGAR
jgi:pyruvate dehydrogenase E1 component alpha subunit